MSVGKWFVVLLVVCVSVSYVEAQRSQSKIVSVTISYDNDEIVVQPKTFHAHPGDTVEFRTDDGGELILLFVNPFSNNGWVVQSEGGVLSLVAQNSGDYKYRCSIRYPDGRVVGWEAGDHDEYEGGNGNVGPRR